MARALTDHRLPVCGARVFKEQEIRASVQLALSSPLPSEICERRGGRRYPYPYPVHLTPVDETDVTKNPETIVVIGKHLSDCGLDFYYAEPIPHRRLIASMRRSDGNWIGFLLELSWCRFTQHGWYENGGRFLSLAESPLGKRVNERLKTNTA